jgi:hypothetical protein
MADCMHPSGAMRNAHSKNVIRGPDDIYGARELLFETISQRSPRFSSTTDSNVGPLTGAPAFGLPTTPAMLSAHAIPLLTWI